MSFLKKHWWILIVAAVFVYVYRAALFIAIGAVWGRTSALLGGATNPATTTTPDASGAAAT